MKAGFSYTILPYNTIMVDTFLQILTIVCYEVDISPNIH
jgi:hypothetical protein